MRFVQEVLIFFWAIALKENEEEKDGNERKGKGRKGRWGRSLLGSVQKIYPFK